MIVETVTKVVSLIFLWLILYSPQGLLVTHLPLCCSVFSPESATGLSVTLSLLLFLSQETTRQKMQLMSLFEKEGKKYVEWKWTL